MTTTTSITTAAGVPPADLYIPAASTSVASLYLTVAQALRYLKISSGATAVGAPNVKIVDSAINIQKNLSSLQTYLSKIESLREKPVQGSSLSQRLTLTDSEFQKFRGTTASTGLLGKWISEPDNKINVTNISATRAKTVWDADKTFIAKISIKDTAVNIQNNFSNLLGLQTDGALDTINQSNSTSLISLSKTQYTNSGTLDLLNRINKQNYKLNLTGITVKDLIGGDGGIGGATGLKDNSKVRTVSIIDNTQEIDDNLKDLQRAGMKISTISQKSDDSDKILDVTAAEIRANRVVLGKIITGYQLHAENVTADQLNYLRDNKKVIQIDIVDTAKNISRNWNTLHAIDSAALTSVTVSDYEIDAETYSSDTAIKITAEQLAVSKSLLNKFTSPSGDAAAPVRSFSLEITNATVSQLDDFSDLHEISKIDIVDTSDNILENIDKVTMSLSLINNIKTSNLAKFSLNYQTYFDNKSTFQKINKGVYNLEVTDITIADLEDEKDFKTIDSFTVMDEAVNIETNLDLLHSIGKKINSIQIFPDSTEQELTLTATEFLNRQSVINKFDLGYTVNIEHASVKQALALSENSSIKSIDIFDSGQNIQSYWNSLVKINDLIDDFSTTTSYNFVLTVDEYKSGLNVQLPEIIKSSDSNIKFVIKDASIEQAQDLLDDEMDAGNIPSNFISGFLIKDNSANISANLSTLKTLGSKVSSINLTTSPTPLEINYSDIATYSDEFDKIIGSAYRFNVSNVPLNKVADLSNLNINRYITKMKVNADAGAIKDNLSILISAGNKISSISLTNSTDIVDLTYAQYVSGKAVLNKISDNGFMKLTEVPVYAASAAASDINVKEVNVKGSSSLISRTWDALKGLGIKLTKIFDTDASPISLSFNQWNDNSTLRQKFVDSSGASLTAADAIKFDVHSATIDNVDNLQGSASVNKFSVKESADIIDDSANLAKLNSSNKLDVVTLEDPSTNLQLTPSLIDSYYGVLNKIKNSLGLNTFKSTINSATASEAIAINTDAFPDSASSKIKKENVSLINVVDGNDAIETNFNTLNAMTKLDSVVLKSSTADPATIADQTLTLTEEKVLAGSSILSKVKSYFLDISGVQMVNLTNILSKPNVKDISISDTTAAISTDFDKIIDLVGSQVNLKDMEVSDAAPLDVTYDQWYAAKTKLNALPGADFEYNLSNVLTMHLLDGNTALNNIAPLQNVEAIDAIVSIKIKDTAFNISENWDKVNSAYNPTTDFITGIDFYNFNLNLPDTGTIQLTATQIMASTALLDDAALLNGNNPIAIKTSSADLQAKWSDLVNRYYDATDGSAKTSVLQLASISLTDTDKVYLTEAQQGIGTGAGVLKGAPALINKIQSLTNQIETISS